MSEREEFDLCTNQLFDGDVWDITCKLGLWDVVSGNFDEAEEEALENFRENRDSGEYDKILSNN